MQWLKLKSQGSDSKASIRKADACFLNDAERVKELAIPNSRQLELTRLAPPQHCVGVRSSSTFCIVFKGGTRCPGEFISVFFR